MKSAFDLLVLAAFFAPMGLLLAGSLLSWRPSRCADGLLGLPPGAAVPAAPASGAALDAAEEPVELRRAA